MKLELCHLGFHYPKQERMIFSDVSFGLDKGEIISILGTNGAGKSTLLNCMANLYRPITGDIFIDGRNMKEMRQQEVAKYIGYVPQVHNPAYAYSVLDFVVMGRTPYIGVLQTPREEDYSIAEEALRQIGISHLIDKPYTEISGGERQMVTIARVLAQQPDVILLDEPTAHLDYGNQIRMTKLIRKLADSGYAVILTTHMPDHVIMLQDMVGILDHNGHFTFGKTQDILSDALLSKLYSIELKLVYVDEAKRDTCISIVE
ncbi:ABC transporter related protein [Methanocorpusculum labreanum Z]|uniref:Cobalamin import ATP-binding protein BtuD n=1 Tax=Methanocorpusculum labreanum (strain ATCC 43576 / DSM 4855 / Z) TaxID=410358 RepID=A2SU74_METLZ|nr:ABC transporter ATP-binding protein [Methanocorpusculum labreanum]ABN07880.1 ABC transporter related protein [Methanocorpusculum labreanum Z]